jgi:hypothetical protein
MISKELLKVVLGYEDYVSIMTLTEGYRDIKYDILSPHNGHYTETINKFELQYKCKQWAEWVHGYLLISNSYNYNGYCEIKRITEERLVSIAWEPEKFSTELEAVIAACQWIVDEERK